ncbi:crossover junction endodeoxyribonuclease RuvC [Candidatus Laterigemmans baculatus]|uniref:crossover junction endodeoxyribonuclease RuvC n=1 Tax=Candidatus Laterigemmans baculatus TaxID=2770505 RepID=UPI001F201F0E|nr:crossover junction endodeoxyribonuclease RuvC [Candidatus Laterigemmans baculatus]
MGRFLGIDPGLNTSGYGVIETSPRGIRLVEAGVIRTKSRASLEHRLGELHEALSEIVATLRPDMMALEQLFSHYERPRTAILMGHARGVICLAAQLAGIPVESYAPTRVKKLLTGSGRAPKSQMQLAVKLQLNLDTLPEPADVADALAIALCGYHFTRLAAA